MAVESPYLFAELVLNEGLPLMAFSLKVRSFNVNIISWVNLCYWAHQLSNHLSAPEDREPFTWQSWLRFLNFSVYPTLSSKSFIWYAMWLSHTGMHKIKIFSTLAYVTYCTIKYLSSTNKCLCYKTVLFPNPPRTVLKTMQNNTWDSALSSCSQDPQIQNKMLHLDRGIILKQLTESLWELMFT